MRNGSKLRLLLCNENKTSLLLYCIYLLVILIEDHVDDKSFVMEYSHLPFSRTEADTLIRWKFPLRKKTF
jgi:hypothetical protein